MRSLLLATSMACCAVAGADAQPVSKVTLDVELKMASGFGAMHIADGPRVAVAADGTIAVVLAERHRSANDEALQLEVFAFDRGGRQKFRVAPLQLQQGPSGKSEGWPTDRLAIAIAPSGDIVVFSGAYLPDSARARWFHLAADGTIRHQGLVRAPVPSPDNTNRFAIERFVATPDDGVMLAGGFGLGPEAWWLGKFTLDGTPVWQGGPGPGYPNRVIDVGLRADGSWLVLLDESREAGPITRHLDTYDRDGRRLSRKKIDDDKGASLADLPEGKMVTLDKHHDGFVADRTDHIERIDRDGAVRWRSAPGLYSDAVAAPDGQVVAIAWPNPPFNEPGSVRLVRFANP